MTETATQENQYRCIQQEIKNTFNIIRKKKTSGVSPKVNRHHNPSFILFTYPRYFFDSGHLAKTFNDSLDRPFFWEKESDFGLINDEYHASYWMNHKIERLWNKNGLHLLYDWILKNNLQEMVLEDMYLHFTDLFKVFRILDTGNYWKTSISQCRMLQQEHVNNATPIEFTEHLELFKQLLKTIDTYYLEWIDAGPSCPFLNAYDEHFFDKRIDDYNQDTFTRLLVMTVAHEFFFHDDSVRTKGTDSTQFSTALTHFLAKGKTDTKLITSLLPECNVKSSKKTKKPHELGDFFHDDSHSFFQIIGDSGSGKSTLLHYLQNTLALSTKLFRINASSLMYDASKAKDLRLIRDHISDRYMGFALSLEQNISTSNTIVLFDAFNELSLKSHHINALELRDFENAVLRELCMISTRYTVIVTSRSVLPTPSNEPEHEILSIMNKTIAAIMIDMEKEILDDGYRKPYLQEVYDRLRLEVSKNRPILGYLVLPFYMSIYLNINQIKKLHEPDHLAVKLPNLYKGYNEGSFHVEGSRELMDISLEYERYLCYQKTNFYGIDQPYNFIDDFFTWILPYAAYCATRQDRKLTFLASDFTELCDLYGHLTPNLNLAAIQRGLNDFDFLSLYVFQQKNSDIALRFTHEKYAKHLTGVFIKNILDLADKATLTQLPIPSLALSLEDVEMEVYQHISEGLPVEATELKISLTPYMRVRRPYAYMAVIAIVSCRLTTELNRMNEGDHITIEAMNHLHDLWDYLIHTFKQLSNSVVDDAQVAIHPLFIYYATPLISIFRNNASELSTKLSQLREKNTTTRYTLSCLYQSLNYALALTEAVLQVSHVPHQRSGLHHKAKILEVIELADIHSFDLCEDVKLFQLSEEDLYNRSPEQLESLKLRTLNKACDMGYPLSYSLRGLIREKNGFFRKAFEDFYHGTLEHSSVEAYLHKKAAGVALDYELTIEYLEPFINDGFDMDYSIDVALAANQTFSKYYKAKRLLSLSRETEALPYIQQQYDWVTANTQKSAKTNYAKSVKVPLLYLKIILALSDSKYQSKPADASQSRPDQDSLIRDINDRLSACMDLLKETSVNRSDRWNATEDELTRLLHDATIQSIITPDNLTRARALKLIQE